jgi:phospholipid/cholesterol/gamma-HCH transport system substrate-binding protein
MMKEGRTEVAVGVFTFIGLTLFAFVIFFVSDIYVFKKGYEFFVKFDYVSILDQGAPVRMSGVRVGEVKKLQMTYEEKTQKPVVILTLFVNNEVVLREKSRIVIRGTTPMSEPHIEIVSSGVSDGVPLEPGALIRGVDPIPMEKFIATANEITEQLKGIVNNVSDFLADEESSDAIRSTLINMKTLTGTLNEILVGKKESIQVSIVKFGETVDNLEATSSKIRAGDGTAGKLLMDDELYNELLAFVKDLKAHPWKLLAKPKGDKKKFLIF